MVYASGHWTAKLTDTVKWASIDRLEGEGLSQVKFLYSRNYGLSRKVGIVLKGGDQIDTVMMVQASGVAEPILHFNQKEMTIAQIGGPASVGFKTNLPFNIPEFQTLIEYSDGTDEQWITDLQVFEDSVDFQVAPNNSGFDRSASIKIFHVDGDDKTMSSSMVLIQKTDKPFISFDPALEGVLYSSSEQNVVLPFETNVKPFLNSDTFSASVSESWVVVDSLTKENLYVTIKSSEEPSSRKSNVKLAFNGTDGTSVSAELVLAQDRYVKNYTFKEVRDLAASGSYTFVKDGILDVIVIGDKDNENMELNPNTGNRKIDYTVNGLTNYVESADGEYGFRIQCAEKADNVFSRYSKVQLSLEGLTVTRETDPERYTISNMKATNVLSSEDGSATDLPAKVMGIDQISDKDVYTYINLSGLEASFKYGSYTNCHEGYQLKIEGINPNGASPAFYDCVPFNFRDKNGNSIYMLTNNATPWRRTGKGVVQGSCDVSAIVVKTDLPRFAYKGDLGKYNLRVLEESDIVSTGSAFSNVLLEWHWDHASQTTMLNPTKGEGSISFSLSGAVNGLTIDTNSKVNNDGKKGFVTNGTMYYGSDTWWDTVNDRAPYFEFDFSTEGISGSNLVLNWSACAGNGGGSAIQSPAVWHVEYSTNGTSFSKLSEQYAIHPFVWWSSSLSYYAIPGLHEYSTALPSSLLGHKNVIVRLVASGKEAATATTETGGNISQISGTPWVRFGEISIEYN